jgi:magnesium transporter
MPQPIIRRPQRKLLHYHPVDTLPEIGEEPVYTVFDYNANELTELKELSESDCRKYHKNGNITWINIDGLRKRDVEQLCAHYGVHDLVVEDILNRNERPKMEEAGNVIFCVLPQMFFNPEQECIEMEQVSIVMGKDFVLSFQEEASRDVFDPVRRHLRDEGSKIRQRTTDYLMYNLLDVIVDSYFDVLERLADSLESLEDTILKKQTVQQLARVSALRRDVAVLRRALLPVRELVAHFVRSDSDLLDDRNEKYYRDILDHTIQANDFMENHRDMLMNLQDLYMNQINLKMNEVMKVFTMVATLLAPATVIGGIFGMNFNVIPLTHQAFGFWIAVGAMLIIPVLMMIWFKRRGWY